MILSLVEQDRKERIILFSEAFFQMVKLLEENSPVIFEVAKDRKSVV